MAIRTEKSKKTDPPVDLEGLDCRHVHGPATAFYVSGFGCLFGFSRPANPALGILLVALIANAMDRLGFVLAWGLALSSSRLNLLNLRIGISSLRLNHGLRA